MTRPCSEAALRDALEALAAVHAVVRFEANGAVRLAAEHSAAPDDRVVVRVPLVRPGDASQALCKGSQALTESLDALTARRSLRLVGEP